MAVESNSASEEGKESTERDITIAPSPGFPKLGGDTFGGSCSNSGAPSPTDARMSTGGKASRKQLASKAARKAAPPPVAIQAAPSAGAMSRTMKKRGRGPAAQRSRAPVDCDSDVYMSPGSNVDEPIVKKEKLDDDGDDKVVTDPLQRLIALQTFVGFWEFGKKLLKICSVGVTEDVPKGVDSKIWATILALAFLELKMGKVREVWEMVVNIFSL